MANQNEENEEIEIQHRITIEEEGIDVSDLPDEIKDAMRKFNAKLEKYEESGEPEIFFELQKDDVAIADNIITFLEEDSEEDDDEEKVEVKKPINKKTAPPVVEVAPPIVAAPVVAAPVVEVAPPAPIVVKTAEEQVLELMKPDKKGIPVISKSDLEKIINREADYPTEQVGNLKLKKQYMIPFYEKA